MSQLSKTLALDAMSGDQGFRIAIDALKRVLPRHADLAVVVVGDEPEIAAYWPDRPARVRLLHAPEVVAMDESPVDALRKKKQSSMRMAIDLVKSGEADACVSAGNTGALMAIAKFVLKTLPGIDRPAIMAELPTRDGHLYMLDVGANAICSAEQLYQFAVMGSIVAGRLMTIDAPRVALLNIGSEDNKGRDEIRDAAALIANGDVNYVGFVEGSTLFDGHADVVVADGFTGNIALKTMEGTAKLIGDFLREAFSSSLLSRLQALVALPALRRLRARTDPRAYNGASLVGLNGIVVKSHGGADAVAFEHAIETAILELADNLPADIKRRLNGES
ncbi:MAG: phosphate acyltransferase PlsX [Pseudomonadota bacterium]